MMSWCQSRSDICVSWTLKRTFDGIWHDKTTEILKKIATDNLRLIRKLN